MQLNLRISSLFICQDSYIISRDLNLSFMNTTHPCFRWGVHAWCVLCKGVYWKKKKKHHTQNTKQPHNHTHPPPHNQPPHTQRKRDKTDKQTNQKKHKQTNKKQQQQQQNNQTNKKISNETKTHLKLHTLIVRLLCGVYRVHLCAHPDVTWNAVDTLGKRKKWRKRKRHLFWYKSEEMNICPTITNAEAVIIITHQSSQL